MYGYIGLALFLVLSYSIGWIQITVTTSQSFENGHTFIDTKKNMRLVLGPINMNIGTYGKRTKADDNHGVLMQNA